MSVKFSSGLWDRLTDFCFRVLRGMIKCSPSEVQNAIRRDYACGSTEFSLNKLKERGFNPKSVIDCGAYQGEYARMVKRVFPAAFVLMIEPQAVKQPFLARVREQFPGTVDFISCLLGPEPREAVTFYDMESGSSLLEELSNYPRKTLTLPMRTLDDILREKHIESPEFLKLDVQGYEIEVLRGAEQTMHTAEVILLEVSLLQFNRSAPLLDEVIHFMKNKGFVTYDICNLLRWGDGVLLQVDLFFVRSDSLLRKVDFVIKQFDSSPASAIER